MITRHGGGDRLGNKEEINKSASRGKRAGKRNVSFGTENSPYSNSLPKKNAGRFHWRATIAVERTCRRRPAGRAGKRRFNLGGKRDGGG